MTKTHLTNAHAGSRLRLALAGLVVGLLCASCATSSALEPVTLEPASLPEQAPAEETLENGQAASAAASDAEAADAESVADTLAAAPGVVYFTTDQGQLQVLTPSTGALEVAWDTADSTTAWAYEVAPGDGGVQLLLAGREAALDTSLHRIENGQILDAEGAEDIAGAICLDSHASGAFTVGHRIQLSADNSQGTEFTQVALAPATDALVELTRKSTFCPRYNAARDIVATSNLTTAGDVRTETLFVDTADGSHQVAVDGCGLTQRSFSPDDQWLLVSVICYGDQWADSGLYALRMAELFEVQDLADMTRLAQGNFGRAAWHADGFWIVASVVDAEPGQTPELSLSNFPTDLVVMNTNGELFRHQPLGSDLPHSVLWASEAVHRAS